MLKKVAHCQKTVGALLKGQSYWNFHWKCQNSAKFLTFLIFFAVNFEPICNFFLNVWQHSDSKTIRKVYISCIKRENVKIFWLICSQSEMFLKQNAATVFWKMLLLSLLIVLEPNTKYRGKCTHIASKTSKTSIVFTFSGSNWGISLLQIELISWRKLPETTTFPSV